MDECNNPLTSVIVWKASAQVGKTEFILNVLGYFIDQDPCPMILLQPSKTPNAEDFSKERVAPMIRDTPCLREKVGNPKSRSAENTVGHKQFPGGHLTIGGANSPAGLASKPIRVVLADEIDRYPQSAGTEGDPLKLVAKRTTTFWNRKLIEVSTPTNKGSSRIEQEYEKTDMRQYHVPCPKCGHKQALKWENLKWKVDEYGLVVKDSVRYECKECRTLIPESKKTWMLREGKWIARKPFNGKAGFHINELYSPWSTWWSVVENYLEAKDDPDKLKVWTNTSKGESFEMKAEDTPDWERLYHRREPYQPGVVPSRACLLTAAVDVQLDRLELMLVGWNRKEAWVVDTIIIPGDPEQDKVWLELDEMIERDWEHSGGSTIKIRFTTIDSGYKAERVYSYTQRKNPLRCIAIKGKDKLEAFTARPKILDVTIRGTKIKKGAWLMLVGTNQLKESLYGRLKLPTPTDSIIESQGYPPGYIHFPKLDEEFFKQLTAEQLVGKKTKDGFVKHTWEKTYQRNEALDLMCYNMAAHHAINAHLWGEARWAELESQHGIKTFARNTKPQISQRKPITNQEKPENGRKKRRSSFWNR